jgi:hypothetical protein
MPKREVFCPEISDRKIRFCSTAGQKLARFFSTKRTLKKLRVLAIFLQKLTFFCTETISGQASGAFSSHNRNYTNKRNLFAAFFYDKTSTGCAILLV